MEARDTFVMIALLLVISCLAACGTPTPSPTPPWFSPTPRPTPTITPTPAPYGHFFPMPPDVEPKGGWKIHKLDELDAVIQYPAAYDDGCGTLFVAKKPDHLLVGFARPTIRIRLYEEWNGDLDAHIADVASQIDGTHSQLLTMTEPFLVDGEPAYRFMYRIADPEREILAKYAAVVSNGKLYEFQFAHHYAFQCDPSPFPQEAVYEHMLSTWKFIR